MCTKQLESNHAGAYGAGVCGGLQHTLRTMNAQTGLYADLPLVLQLCDSQLIAAAVASQCQAARLLRTVLGTSHPSFNAAAYAAFTAGLPYSLATAMTQASFFNMKELEN